VTDAERMEATLPLLDRSDGFRHELSRLLNDDWLRKTYRRGLRLRAGMDFLGHCCQEIVANPGIVIETGCETGEFLECCRHFGCEPYGIRVGSPEGLNVLARHLADGQELVAIDGGFWQLITLARRYGPALVVVRSLEKLLSIHQCDNQTECIRRPSWWQLTSPLFRDLGNLVGTLRDALRPGGHAVLIQTGSLNQLPFERHFSAILTEIGGFHVTRPDALTYKLQRTD